MNTKFLGAGGVAVAVALLMSASGVEAFGNACRRIDFRVTNDFADEITVEKFELYSASEGRYLNENFADISVPEGAQNFVVRLNETVEYAENDFISQIRVTWTHISNTAGDFHRHTTVDYEAGGTCVADRSYTAVVD